MKTDAQIQKDVMDQMKWEPALDAAEIGVAVKNSIVTLSGKVNTYAKKIAAERAAKKVMGVKAVAEDIQVGISLPGRLTDAEIAAAVVSALKWHSSVPDEKIKIKVEDGRVTLEGEVDWEYQRRLAKNAIENLNGVISIIDLITIKRHVLAADVKEKITDALKRTAMIDAQKISVDISGNKVVLKGRVKSFAEQEDAVNAAWAAPGVTAVQNDLILEGEEEFAF